MATPQEIKALIQTKIRKKNTSFQAKPEKAVADILDSIVDLIGDGSDAGPGYLVYTAILHQDGGGGAVTATILENTIGDIFWNPADDGQYTANLENGFPNLKTWLSATQGNGAGNNQGVLWFFRATQDFLALQQHDISGADYVNGLADVMVEIRIYP
jgi:hypothetical protein